ncbi:hypothetical protein [Herpetosiphon geysericola]|uniref:Uncharacterized protein n=1 Tax=Herpetosiphon geysericola TaxID=70996 RepID=A0A0P6Y4H8_9CHLR|nr:hypothetical protein [Herpetosiphon geysericola]KPL90995.1 hypothetical protein SE18_04335 [Herpetosiphon geysericola]
MSNLEAQFLQEMLDGYRLAAKQGYKATYYLRMLEELGAIPAAKRLVADPEISSGLQQLCLIGLLSTSAEAIMLKPEYAELFTDAERQVAREKLIALGWNAE